MKKNYCLIFEKQTAIKNMKVCVPMVLYRKNKLFFIDYELKPRTLMYWHQAWFWYWVIYLFGSRYSQNLFGYKKTSGRVLVRKIY